jgi:TRAP-type transport system periplasmic protein
MKKLMILFFAGACLLLFAIACGQSDDVTGASREDAPKREVIELNYSIFFPPTHAHSKAAEAWAREIESRSDNMVKINIYPGGTLTGAGECYDGVVSGISDIGMSVFAYTRGRFPVMEALDLPMGYPTGKVATRVANDFYNELQPKELDDVELLYLHAHGPGLLHTKRPVEKLEDLRGMQIRSTGLSAKMVSALGATPVAMPQGDTYEALHKGVVEGTFAPIEALKGWRQAEVISSTTDCKEIGYTTAMFVVMNKNRFNRMPEDIQSIFTDVSEEWIEEHGRIWDVADEEGLAYTFELGNQVFELSEEENMLWKKAIESVINEYIETAESRGLQGRKNVELLRELIDRQI